MSTTDTPNSVFKPPALHPYQQDAKNFVLTRPSCGLFLDMGLGKTLITLSALYDLNPTKPVLVIAPINIARSTWIDEIEKWNFPLRYKSLIVNEKKQKLSKAERHKLYNEVLTSQPAIYFINRDLVNDLVDNCPVYNKHKIWPFETVIIDELQSFKSYDAKRFKALKKVQPCISRFIGLSGTPTPGGLMDLWSEIYLMDGGHRLGKTITSYRNTYFISDKVINGIPVSWTPKQGAEQIIYDKIKDIVISMKNTTIKLPPVTFNDVNVYMTDSEMKLYKKMMKEHVITIDNQDITAANSAVLQGKLSQMASGAIYTNSQTHEFTTIHTHKCEHCEYIINNTSSPVLIAYHFQSDKQMILDYLTSHGIDARAFDGSPEMLHSWNRREIPVMLLHPASAGHGLNMQQGGHTLIWYTIPSSLEEYLQTNARLHRQGQTEPVIIHHLLTDKTIDKHILYDCLMEKNCSQERLMDAVRVSVKEAN